MYTKGAAKMNRYSFYPVMKTRDEEDRAIDEDQMIISVMANSPEEGRARLRSQFFGCLSDLFWLMETDPPNDWRDFGTLL